MYIVKMGLQIGFARPETQFTARWLHMLFYAVRFLKNGGKFGSVGCNQGATTLYSHASLPVECAPVPPVAQLDRALPSGGKGQGFESLRAGQ
jgi:hypothetical protein